MQCRGELRWEVKTNEKYEIDKIDRKGKEICKKTLAKLIKSM
jgi:hypothetical protein